MAQVHSYFISSSYPGITNAGISVYPARWFTLVYRNAFYFYVVFPFLIKKSETPGKLIWNAGVILISLTLLRAYFDIIEIRTFVYFSIFIAGRLAAWTGISEKLKYSAPIFFIPLIFIRLRWVTADAVDPINDNVIPVVLSLSLMLLFFCFIFLEWVKSIQLNSRISAMVGKIAVASYPVYLFHTLVLDSLKRTLMYSQYFNPIIFDLLTISILIPMVVILCIIFKYMKEKFYHYQFRG